MNYTLDEAVVMLHNLARTVEQEVGVGELSHTIRECADKLNEIINKE